MRRRLAGDQGMRMGESHSYPAAIGRPDRDDLIVAIGLVRSTADGQTNTIARARFVESRMSPIAGPRGRALPQSSCLGETQALE
jgi:hypothetical protein